MQQLAPEWSGWRAYIDRSAGQSGMGRHNTSCGCPPRFPLPLKKRAFYPSPRCRSVTLPTLATCTLSRPGWNLSSRFGILPLFHTGAQIWAHRIRGFISVASLGACSALDFSCFRQSACCKAFARGSSLQVGKSARRLPLWRSREILSDPCFSFGRNRYPYIVGLIHSCGVLVPPALRFSATTHYFADAGKKAVVQCSAALQHNRRGCHPVGVVHALVPRYPARYTGFGRGGLRPAQDSDCGGSVECCVPGRPWACILGNRSSHGPRLKKNVSWLRGCYGHGSSLVGACVIRGLVIGSIGSKAGAGAKLSHWLMHKG